MLGVVSGDNTNRKVMDMLQGAKHESKNSNIIFIQPQAHRETLVSNLFPGYRLGGPNIQNE